MLKRIYLLLLAIAAIVMAVVTFYAHSWLGSIGDPTIASAGFVFQTTFAWMFLWISFVVLSAFALFVAWQSGIKWPACATFGYFVLFMLSLLYNDSAYRNFLSDNSMSTGYVLLNPFYAALIFLISAVFLIAAYMLTINLRVKFGKGGKEPAEEEGEKEHRSKKDNE